MQVTVGHNAMGLQMTHHSRKERGTIAWMNMLKTRPLHVLSKGYYVQVRSCYTPAGGAFLRGQGGQAGAGLGQGSGLWAGCAGHRGLYGAIPLPAEVCQDLRRIERRGLSYGATRQA